LLLQDLIQAFKSRSELISGTSDLIHANNRVAHLTLGLSRVVQGKEVPIHVADIGGGNGYFLDYAEFSFPNIKFEWTVFETASVVKGYNNINTKENLSFRDLSSMRGKRFDLSVISCTLQYVDNYLGILKNAKKISPYVIVLRLPLTSERIHQVFVQRPMCGVYAQSQASWPIRFFAESLFMEEIQQDFELVCRLSDYEETVPVNGVNIPVKTLLLKSR
jgi:putative methyltransferase (TIGR04325 family)